MTKRRASWLALLGVTVVACSATDPELSVSAVVEGAFGDYHTPDPGNRWLKGVDVSKLVIGEESRLEGEDAIFEDLVQRIVGFQNELVDAGVNENVIRAFHAKPHACVRGEFQVRVPDGLERARVGLFAEDASYPVWIRMSNGVAYFQQDKKVDVRGLAMKLMKVPGDKLNPGQEDAGTQDFILINTPTSFTTDAVSLIDFVEVAVDARLHKQSATEWASGVLAKLPGFVPKDKLSDLFGTWSSLAGPGGYLVKHGNERLLGFLVSKLVPATLKHGSLLGSRFWTQGAIAMGLHAGDPMTAPAREAAKLAVDPGVVLDAPLPGDEPLPDGKWCHSKGVEIPHAADEDYLHSDLVSRMRERETCMVVRMQFQEHPSTQLIEDTTVEWQEKDSPFQTVGFVRIPKMDLDDPASSEKTAFCNDLAYTPWHSVPDHRPLGNFMRARLKVYNALAVTRGALQDADTGALLEPTGDEFSAEEP